MAEMWMDIDTTAPIPLVVTRKAQEEVKHGTPPPIPNNNKNATSTSIYLSSE